VRGAAAQASNLTAQQVHIAPRRRTRRAQL
jgi:hypothetical protein